MKWPRTVTILALLAIVAAGSGMVWAQSAGTFTATGSMTTPRIGHTATLLANEKVLIAGGSQDRPSSAELYDPSTGTFTSTGDMTTPRSGHTATLLPNGDVLIIGGSPERPASAELYDPSSGTFTDVGDLIASFNQKAILLPSGSVLLAHRPRGGCCPLVITEIHVDPATGTFSAFEKAFTTTRRYSEPVVTLLPDGRVLLALCCDESHIYDPASGALSLTGRAALGGFYGYTATLLTTGEVLLAGGYWELTPDSSANADLYDPLTGTYSPTRDMTTGRSGHTATLLPDGTVLIAGASAELYDRTTGAFSSAAEMGTPRGAHTATLLQDGRVLIAGGRSIPLTSTASSAELYNPLWLVPAPALFSLSGDGRRQGAIQHATTYEIASPSNPAVVGEALAIYGTGLIDGSVIPPAVAIGGRMAEVLWFGELPGSPGVNQVNIRVPSGVTPGDAVPVRLYYIGRPSNEVTIAVR